MWLEWKDKLAKGKTPVAGYLLPNFSQVLSLVDTPCSGFSRISAGLTEL